MVKTPFPVESDEVDQMVNGLISENDGLEDEIKALSRKWVQVVMGQAYRKDKKRRRPKEYSKEKIIKVLIWRQKNNLLRTTVPKRIHNSKDEAKEFYDQNGRNYWYGVDKEGSPTLWLRNELMDWNNFSQESSTRIGSLLFQACLNAMPPDVHDFNFVLIVDNIDIEQLKYPNSGPIFLKTFTSCCPDRLKRAVMVTGTAGGFLYNIAKTLASKSLTRKIKVAKKRKEAGQLLVQMGIIENQEAIPDFLGGNMTHSEGVTKDLSSMITCLEFDMNDSYQRRNSTDE